MLIASPDVAQIANLRINGLIAASPVGLIAITGIVPTEGISAVNGFWETTSIFLLFGTEVIL